MTYSRIGATEVDTSLTGRRVVAVLNLLVATRGKPRGIRVDNGPEFISQVLDSISLRGPRIKDLGQEAISRAVGAEADPWGMTIEEHDWTTWERM